ncbi:SDR family NAD(P)-dependent oxidoreductase [Demequina sp.]|uniref:SDR family NAD(P)-dependent oxidoreductase n=1 Tax=Demequina sp. TaxID=2050685 RepID=UPI003D0AF184
MGRVEGKTAIITGAASGMGLAAVELFAREGANVVATDIVPGLPDAVAPLEGNIISVHHDVADSDSWDGVISSTLDAFGGVDVLINNAGIFVPKGVEEEDLDGWNRLLGINLTGVFLGTKAVLPHMKAAGGGSVVNCASIAAIVGGNGDGHGAAYSASKGAVRSFTKHCAQWHAAENIRFNSVHPGGVFTGMVSSMGFATREEATAAMGSTDTPLPPYMGMPIDIAYGYLYLASDESAFVTGIELVIDGGFISH